MSSDSKNKSENVGNNLDAKNYVPKKNGNVDNDDDDVI
jgi:hypothetical protein